METDGSLALRFLGVGNAQAVELGSAAVVLEREGAPLLLVDCGQEALTHYLERYRAVPDAVFITHAHFDHIGGLERLFYRTYFDVARRGRVKLFVAADLVPVLQHRIANYPSPLAEGGANFWDAFQLVPVDRGFWHAGYWFDVFAVRHHLPHSAFGIALRGSFLFTGDTRPIPEVIAHHADGAELIAHDCGLQGNPSHTGLDDLMRDYTPETRERMIVYHYATTADREVFERAGLRVAIAGEAHALAPALDAMQAATLNRHGGRVR